MSTKKKPEPHKRHPIQPIVEDERGVQRFRKNAIVEHLLNHGGIDLNQLAVLPFTNEDRQQFAQLIGYSLSGYGDLSYVDAAAHNSAVAMLHKSKTSEHARIEQLEHELRALRIALRKPIAALFGVHPDDLRRNG